MWVFWIIQSLLLIAFVFCLREGRIMDKDPDEEEDHGDSAYGDDSWVIWFDDDGTVHEWDYKED